MGLSFMRVSASAVLLERLRGRSAGFLLWKSQQLVLAQARRFSYGAEEARVPAHRLQQLFAGDASSVLEALRHRRGARMLPGFESLTTTATSLRSEDPEYVQRLIEAADRICQRRFWILAAGERHLGEEIDWHRDYASGFRFPPGYRADFDEMDLGRPSDVRIVWELNRLHFLATLGQAYRLTGDIRYAQQVITLTRSWLSANPVAFSINWANAMEAGIRAVNLLLGFELIKTAACVTEEFAVELLRSLVVHARFICRNLELNDLPSNHLVADYAGLAHLGTYLPEYPEHRHWLRTAIRGLETEARRQILDDGVDYEKAIAYHRLVAEMLLSSAMVLERNGSILSTEFRARLERMFEFISAYMGPDGRCPLVGDNDDGRLFWLGDQPLHDHRYLLSTAAVYFNRPDFARASGRFWQESAWILGQSGRNDFQRLLAESERDKPPGSVAFPAGGFFVMKNHDDQVFIDCGDVGRRGAGGHGHNDVLSLTVWLAGERILVDPGSSRYTADRNSRRWTVSTAAHNLVVVDGEEIAAPRSYGLGSVPDTPARVIEWNSEPLGDRFVGEHYGYGRLLDPVVHRREVAYHRSQRAVVIFDDLSGQTAHDLTLFLHFAPELDVMVRKEGFIVSSRHTSARFMVQVEGAADLRAERQVIFERYGLPTPAWTGVSVVKAQLPYRFVTRISPAAIPTGV